MFEFNLIVPPGVGPLPGDRRGRHDRGMRENRRGITFKFIPILDTRFWLISALHFFPHVVNILKRQAKQGTFMRIFCSPAFVRLSRREIRC